MHDLGPGTTRNRTLVILTGICTTILIILLLHQARPVFTPLAFALLVIAIVWPIQRRLQTKLPGTQVKDAGCETAQVKLKAQAAYPPFNLTKDAAALTHAERAAESIGLKPTTIFSNGGLDANWFVKHGVPTVTIGPGQHEIRTIKESSIWRNLLTAAAWRWPWQRSNRIPPAHHDGRK